MAYVIRTDKFSKPHYWCGFAEGNIGHSIVITQIIFNAWFFDDREEAEAVIADFLPSGEWTISEVSKPVASGVLS